MRPEAEVPILSGSGLLCDAKSEVQGSRTRTPHNRLGLARWTRRRQRYISNPMLASAQRSDEFVSYEEVVASVRGARSNVLGHRGAMVAMPRLSIKAGRGPCTWGMPCVDNAR
jgi:hypothetical protein